MYLDELYGNVAELLTHARTVDTKRFSLIFVKRLGMRLCSFKSFLYKQKGPKVQDCARTLRLLGSQKSGIRAQEVVTYTLPVEAFVTRIKNLDRRNRP